MIDIREMQQCIDDCGLSGDKLFEYIKEYLSEATHNLSGGGWDMEDLAGDIDSQE